MVQIPLREGFTCIIAYNRIIIVRLVITKTYSQLIAFTRLFAFNDTNRLKMKSYIIWTIATTYV